MADANAWLAKAEESLASAQADFDARRYNSSARGTYYACFQSAVAALIAEGIVAPKGWGHGFVQAQFSGALVRRRKLYEARLREVLPQALRLRHRADYEERDVSKRWSRESLRQAESMTSAVRRRAGGDG